MLKAKLRESNVNFVFEMNNPSISKIEINAIIDKKAKEIDAFIKSNKLKNVAYGWSGGKDSQAMVAVMNRIGIDKCVFAYDKLFEYAEFLRWALNNKPDKCDTVDVKHDWNWLLSNQEHLFPQNSKSRVFFYSNIQNKVQDDYIAENNLDAMFFGRRLKDGNSVGKNGIKTLGNGVMKISPIYDWTHEETMATTKYFSSGYAPIYFWEKGFICGTNVWPCRNPCDSHEQAWNEISKIEYSIIVESAKNGIKSAVNWLEKYSESRK